MTRWRTAAVAGAVLAVVVQGVGSIGWGVWGAARRRGDLEPVARASFLEHSELVALPSSLWWLRGLVGSQFSGVPSADASAALARVGELQSWWMPTDPVGPKNLAQAAALRGQPERALELVHQARRRRPVSPYLTRAEALLELHLGRYKKCLDLLAEAQGLAPGFSRPAVEILPDDESWVRVEGLKRRARFYPRLRAEADLALASELRRLGRKDESEQVLQSLAGNPLAELERARWEVQDGEPEAAAERALGQARRTTLPRSVRARAWALAALALAAQGEDRRALEAAESALRLDPDSPSPYLALAAMEERRGDTKLALENARRAWGVAPADVRVLLTVSRLATKADKRADARLALQRAVEVAPNRADLRARLVSLLLDQGRYMQAAMVLSNALDRFPTDQRLLRLAARLQTETTRKR